MIAQGSVLDAAEVVREMSVDHRGYDLFGSALRVTGTVSPQEAEFLTEAVRRRRLARCVETGVAYGCSTVAICRGLRDLERAGLDCRLWGVDPCQRVEFNGAALAALRRCGLDHLFELLEGPSHLMLPQLIQREEKVDLVFVDGWHTFDYTLVDVFMADKLLRPGGILMMHDMCMPSKQKVWRYLKTHRRYRRLPGPMRPLLRRLGSAVRQTIRGKLRTARVHLAESLLLVAEKAADYEPRHDFYRDF